MQLFSFFEIVIIIVGVVTILFFGTIAIFFLQLWLVSQQL